MPRKATKNIKNTKDTKDTKNTKDTMTESKTTTTTTTVLNGDSPQSTTLRHLLTLPAVQDGVRAFSANPVGKMSIQLSNSAYQLVGAPMLSLFTKPLAYVTPYAQRVDELGDQTLSKVVERYPAVKKSSPELLQEAKQAVYAPVRHVTEVYNGAYQRTGGANHAVASGRAAVTTAAVVSVEGAVFALREALKLGESFRFTETLRAALDQLEQAALNRRQDTTAAGDAAESQNGPELKASST